MNGDDRFTEPEYRVGAYFANAEFPNTNALTESIVGDARASTFGTDPAAYAQENVKANFGIPSVEDVKSGVVTVGRAIAGSLVALIVIAVGLLILVKQ